MTYLDFPNAAKTASVAAGIYVDEASIRAECRFGILPTLQVGHDERIRDSDARRLGAAILPFQATDSLFNDLGSLFQNGSALRVPSYATAGDMTDPTTVFVRLTSDLSISFIPTHTRPELLQLLIPQLRASEIWANSDTHNEFTLQRLELNPGVSLWANRAMCNPTVQAIWRRCLSEEALPREVDILTLPKIYGNKHRLTAFLAGVLRAYLPEGGRLLDLMSGTGIVASRLSEYFTIYANDANPYASLLTRSQFEAVSAKELSLAIQAVQVAYERNLSALTHLVTTWLEQEARFLHSDLTNDTIEEYRQFCTDIPRKSSTLENLGTERASDAKLFPYCLTLLYFSNAYFGVKQAIQVDSIRYGISQLTEERIQVFLLAALLVACSTCASTPHFAQPPKLARPQAVREVIEHRARDLFAEFLMTARFMLSRSPKESKLSIVSNQDWPSALQHFVDATDNVAKHGRAVYVDPPYTKMQFSRYYHVLNTLIRYDYPGVAGEGRYPPRSTRFSSRFEYQPRPAEREFARLIDACARGRLTTIISYSDTGMVPFSRIVDLMEQAFPVVDLFSKDFRHSSQGKAFRENRQKVTEYLLVGSFHERSSD
jgi:adenine-specific DNA methylase